MLKEQSNGLSLSGGEWVCCCLFHFFLLLPAPLKPFKLCRVDKILLKTAYGELIHGTVPGDELGTVL